MEKQSGEKKRLRKTMPREGLIIVALVLLSLVVRWLEENRNDQIAGYKKNAEVVGVYTKTVFAEPEEYITKSGAKYAIASISEFTGISVMFPRDTAKAVMTGALERDFPDVKNIDPVVENNREGGRIGWLYDREGYRIFVDPYYRIDVRKIELFLLVFAYPLSVLIRFIVRKIRPSGITV